MARKRLPEAERREVILDAATHVFAEHGYEGTSISEIAAASGVTRPIVYDHFGTKKQLLIELIERHHGRFMASLAAHGSGARLDRELLRTLVEAYLDQVAADPGGWRILCLERSSDPEIAAVQRRTAAEVDAAFASMLPRTISPAKRSLLARGLRGLGNEMSAASVEDGVSRGALVDAVLTLCWDGLGSSA